LSRPDKKTILKKDGFFIGNGFKTKQSVMRNPYRKQYGKNRIFFYQKVVDFIF